MALLAIFVENLEVCQSYDWEFEQYRNEVQSFLAILAKVKSIIACLKTVSRVTATESASVALSYMW